MIYISKPYTTSDGTHTKLNFDLTINSNQMQTIWYKVENDYADYLCTERIDGIVVNLLYYCMEHQHDIVSDHPISEKLYYQLTTFLIPIVSDNISIFHKFKIQAPLDSTVFPSEKAVGTGLSCGVDSFYSVLKNTNADTQNFNVTHFTFFNAGASGSFGGDDARQLYMDRMAEVLPCAKDFSIPLLTVDTNINEFLNARHVKHHTVRSLAIPLLLQKLFSIYYYSSGFMLNEFYLSESNAANYDWFILDCISNENIKFYSTGAEVSRFEKTKLIADSCFAQKHLNVCISEEKNCCKCEKCKRTIGDLYALNKLDLFGQVFDLQYIKANIEQYFVFWAAHRCKPDYQQAYQILKKEKKFTTCALLKGNFFFLCAFFKDKLKGTALYNALKKVSFLKVLVDKIK